MVDLNDFYSLHPEHGVIGTYLYPYRLLGTPDWHSDVSPLQVIQELRINDTDVVITRNGGLFARIPSGSLTFEEKIAFEEKAAQVFNSIICEFCLLGVISEPASPVHISAGKLIENHALITSAGGGREFYRERSIGPSLDLLTNKMWRSYPVAPDDFLATASKLTQTTPVQSISSTLPTLIAGAYYQFSRRQLSEAMIDSWIVVEQILDHYWDRYLSTIRESERVVRMKDSRSFSAAIRAEVLLVAKVLPKPLVRKIQLARGHRNKLAHRAILKKQASKECLDAMKSVIEFLTGSGIAHPEFSEGINW